MLLFLLLKLKVLHLKNLPVLNAELLGVLSYGHFHIVDTSRRQEDTVLACYIFAPEMFGDYQQISR